MVIATIIVMANTGIPQGAAHAYEVGVHSLEAQARRIDSIDTKAAVVLAVDGVFAGLLFGPGRLTEIPRAILLAVVVSLFVSAFLALLGFWTRKHRTAPEFSAMMRFMMRNEEWLKWRFLGNIEEAERKNAEKFKWKVRLVTGSMTALLVDIVLVAGYLVWSTLNGVI